MKMISRQKAITAVTLAVLISPIVSEAEVSTNLLSWMRRISAGEFGAGRGSSNRASARGGSGEWVDGGRGYTRIERGALVRYDTASGDREVLMSEEQLTPPGLERPLRPGGSGADGKRILFATNPRTVKSRDSSPSRSERRRPNVSSGPAMADSALR